jgi:hypothetical protein
MISYEKARQSFRTLTIVSIVINIFLIILGVLSILSLFTIKAVIDNEDFVSQYSTQDLELLQQSTTNVAIVWIGLALVASITILIFSFINLSRLKNKLTLYYIPFYIGIALCLINNIYNLLSSFSLWSFVIQVLIATLYAYTYTRAKLLNNQKD